ncbi:MAG: hypothetical protein Kow0056_15460 [Coriobacteriia bacterium]
MAEERAGGGEAAQPDVPEEALHAARNKKVMAKLVTRLSADSRLERAKAAKLVHDAACVDPLRLEPHLGQLVEALDLPEPQTRWEILGALEEIARVKPMWLDAAVEPATHSLHDEGSSVVRLAAFKMLATYGASSKARASKVWPLLDEALRCYHGDSEYPGMLNALAVMVEGKAPPEVVKEAALLVEPDASHPKAAIARGAKRVFAIATGGKTPRKRKPGGMAPVEPKKPAPKAAKKAAPTKSASKPAAKAAKKAAPKKAASKKSTSKAASKKTTKKTAAKKTTSKSKKK